MTCVPLEHECDQVRRNLADAVSEAFTTPLPPEDLFQLSRDLDRVMNGAKDTVRESEAMAFRPIRRPRKWRPCSPKESRICEPHSTV